MHTRINFINNTDKEILFFEIPLLFELNLQNQFTKSIAIIAKKEIRQARITINNKMDLELFAQLEEKQIKCEEKAKLADYFLENNGTKEEFFENAKNLIENKLL